MPSNPASKSDEQVHADIDRAASALAVMATAIISIIHELPTSSISRLLIMAGCRNLERLVEYESRFRDQGLTLAKRAEHTLLVLQLHDAATELRAALHEALDALDRITVSLPATTDPSTPKERVN